MSNKEEIFTVKTGLGAAHGDSISSTSEKIYYPWVPDEYGTEPQESSYSGWSFPGGVHYPSNLTQSEADEYCQGAHWPGDPSKGQRHQKYAIFAGEKAHIGARTNHGSKSPPTLTDEKVQAVGYHTVYWKTFMNSNNAQVAYWNYSTTRGCPMPVYGLTMDVTVCRGVTTVNNDGNNWTKDTAAQESTYDLQINQVHGLWAELPGGKSWKAMSLLPNGDNWGDNVEGARPKDGQYLFYNLQDMGKESNLQRQALGADGQHKDYVDMDKDGKDKPFTLKLLLNVNEQPPAGHLFMGFCMGFVMGRIANQSKYKFVQINNVNVIDKVNADMMRDKPEYHGVNPKKTGFHDVIVPRPVDINSSLGSRVRLYGPRDSW